jgi:hypothetical protein
MKEWAPLTSNQSMGHKGPVFKAFVHWDCKGSNPITNLIYRVQRMV